MIQTTNNSPDSLGGGVHDDRWTAKADPSRDSDGFTDLHFGNLFDQDETSAGDRIDLSDGRAIDNSTEPIPQREFGMHEIDAEGDAEALQMVHEMAEDFGGLKDQLKQLKAVDPEEYERAQAWLEKHGMDMLQTDPVVIDAEWDE